MQFLWAFNGNVTVPAGHLRRTPGTPGTPWAPGAAPGAAAARFRAAALPRRGAAQGPGAAAKQGRGRPWRIVFLRPG